MKSVPARFSAHQLKATRAIVTLSPPRHSLTFLTFIRVLVSKVVQGRHWTVALTVLQKELKFTRIFCHNHDYSKDLIILKKKRLTFCFPCFKFGLFVSAINLKLLLKFLINPSVIFLISKLRPKIIWVRSFTGVLVAIIELMHQMNVTRWLPR